MIGFGLLAVCSPALLADKNSGAFFGSGLAYVRSSVDFETTFDGIFGLYKHTVTMKERRGYLIGSIKAGYIFSSRHRTYFEFNNAGKTEHDIDGNNVHTKADKALKAS